MVYCQRKPKAAARRADTKAEAAFTEAAQKFRKHPLLLNGPCVPLPVEDKERMGRITEKRRDHK